MYYNVVIIKNYLIVICFILCDHCDCMRIYPNKFEIYDDIWNTAIRWLWQISVISYTIPVLNSNQLGHP